MSANIETMMFTGQVPWHGEGNRIAEAHLYNIAEGIKTAGMDWEVGLKNLVTDDGIKVDHKACYRKSDNRILGVVGPRWTPVQNWDMFNWFQPWLTDKLCALHTAGSLCGGQKVWVLCQNMVQPIEVAKDDMVASLLLLSNSHDGSMAVRVGFTPIRVVCCNTLAAAIDNAASKLIRLRHSSKVLQNMEIIRDTMNLAQKEFEANVEQYKYLATKHFHQGDIQKYVKMLLDIDGVDNEKLPTRTKNIMQDIFLSITNGIGQNNPAISGTWWSAYNGFNQYLNHHKGRTVSNRLDSLWFGQGANLNRKALDLAVKMAV